MHMNKKVTGRAFAIPVGLGIGALISLLVTLAGAAFLSYLITAELMGEGTIGFASMIIMGIATVVGALGAVGLVKRLRLQVCMMTGGCYYLLLLAMTALFFGGRYQGMGVSALVILAGCALVAFIPVKSGYSRKRSKMAYR